MSIYQCMCSDNACFWCDISNFSQSSAFGMSIDKTLLNFWWILVKFSLEHFRAIEFIQLSGVSCTKLYNNQMKKDSDNQILNPSSHGRDK